MKFTTPCFIRNNTPELRKKLEELGYAFIQNGHMECHIPIDKLPYLQCNTERNFSYYMGKNGWLEGVDCGTNEDLFLAIAALRSDSHKYQWHICTSRHLTHQMNEYHEGDWNMCLRDKLSCNIFWRKATVSELIEHFSDSTSKPDHIESTSMTNIQTIEKSVNIALNNLSKAINAVENLKDLFEFKGFPPKKGPYIGVSGGGSATMLYVTDDEFTGDTKELNIKEAVECMKLRGYIIPDDFY